MIGGPIVMIVIVWCLSLAAWRLRARSNRSYNATFILTMILVMLGTFGARQQKKQKQIKVAAAYDQYDQETRNEAQRRKREGQVLTPPDVSRRLRALDVISKTAEGDEAILAESSAIMLKEAGELISVQIAAIEKASQIGGIDPSAISRKDDIDNRIKHYKSCLPHIDKTIQYMKDHDSKFRLLLRDRGMSDQNIDQFFKLRRANENPELAVQVQSLEKEAVLQILGILDHFKSEWGNWTYDDQEDWVQFDDDAASEKYSALIEQLNTILEKQETLTKKING
jgi:hypothetical protein